MSCSLSPFGVADVCPDGCTCLDMMPTQLQLSTMSLGPDGALIPQARFTEQYDGKVTITKTQVLNGGKSLTFSSDTTAQLEGVWVPRITATFTFHYQGVDNLIQLVLSIIPVSNIPLPPWVNEDIQESYGKVGTPFSLSMTRVGSCTSFFNTPCTWVMELNGDTTLIRLCTLDTCATRLPCADDNNLLGSPWGCVNNYMSCIVAPPMMYLTGQQRTGNDTVFELMSLAPRVNGEVALNTTLSNGVLTLTSPDMTLTLTFTPSGLFTRVQMSIKPITSIPYDPNNNTWVARVVMNNTLNMTKSIPNTDSCFGFLKDVAFTFGFQEGDDCTGGDLCDTWAVTLSTSPPDIMTLIGNNGTISCDTYCSGTDPNWYSTVEMNHAGWTPPNTATCGGAFKSNASWEAGDRVSCAVTANTKLLCDCVRKATTTIAFI